MLVLQQARIDRFRAFQMIQDKAQTAGNGGSFSRAVTPYWIIWKTPFGRAEKPSSALLHLLARTSHSRRAAPSGQRLLDSLSPPILACWSTSRKYRGATCLIPCKSPCYGRFPWLHIALRQLWIQILQHWNFLQGLYTLLRD